MARAANMIRNEMAFFAETSAPKSEAPDLKEIGSRLGDLEIDSDGLLTDTSEITLDTYRKMRADPQVKACLTVLKLPILQVDWQLQAETDEGQKLAKWSEMVLREFMDDSMTYYIREMLTGLDFGRSITEKVWSLQPVPKDPDNKSGVADTVIAHKLKTYDPRNIKIKLDPSTMKLTGAVQTVDNAEKLIPANKLLIWTNEKEFGNYNGEAVLRAAYKPWVIKEFLQKFWNIALERYGTPFQTMKVPQGGSLKQAMSLMDMIKTKSGIPLPDGYEMDIHNLANTGMSFKEAIQYQDTMIARAMLIPDLVFGNAGSGAYALSKTHAGIFLLRLNGITQEIGDIISKYLIRPMIQFNYGDVPEYPEFKFSDVADENLKELSEVIKAMIDGKVIAPSENWIRERLGMPPADPDSQEYLDKQRETVMAGLEIQKANNQKAEDKQGQADPKKLTDDKKVKDDPDLKKQAKKQEDFSELSDEELVDYYMTNLRTAARGILNVGIGREE
jgi:hypothetical protein